MRVVVVAEDPLARAGVAALLAGADVDVVAQIAPGEDLPPAEAVAWDLGSDPRSGLDRLQAALEQLPPVVALIGRDEAVAAVLAAGVRGALPRNAPGIRLAAALTAVTHGLVVVDASLAQAVRPRGDTTGGDALTPREQEVLALLAEGLSNKIVADRLGISEHTAKFHVNAIFAKLGATTRTEAVVQAVRRGLLFV